MIRWFKRNWNEPLTIGNLVKLTGWATLLSILLAYPVFWLTMTSFSIVAKIEDGLDKFKKKINDVMNRNPDNEEI